MRHVSALLDQWKESVDVPALVLFDVDGTLIHSFMRDREAPKTMSRTEAYEAVEMLPGRVEAVESLLAAGVDIALCTNQAGVAFGYQSERQVHAKMVRVMEALKLPLMLRKRLWCTKPWISGNKFLSYASPCYVSFGHPEAKLDEYRRLHEAYPAWRKPGPGMIEQAMADHGVDPARTLFVGDMDTDEQAARAAGVGYADAREFFA